MSGWLALSRKFRENEMWKERRVFSRAEAWIYLLMEANYDTSYAPDGRTVDRGCLLTSVRKLADEWMWSKSRVERFLSNLERGTVIGTEAGHSCTIIRLTNYEQDCGLAPPGGTRARQQRSANRDTDEDNKTNKQKQDPPSPSGSHPQILKEQKKSYTPLMAMYPEEVTAMVSEFGRDAVRHYVKVCSDWKKSTGKTKKDDAAFLRNWIRQDQTEGKGFFKSKQKSFFNQSENVSGPGSPSRKPDMPVPAVLKNIIKDIG